MFAAHASSFSIFTMATSFVVHTTKRQFSMREVHLPPVFGANTYGLS